MLMQPQSPSPDYDFILKNQPQDGGKFSISHMHKRTLVTIGVIMGVILLIIGFTLFSGRKNSQFAPFERVLASNQETLRVTKLVQQQLQLQDPQTKALAATVGTTLASDQQQLKSYLAKNRLKVSAAQLAADTDKSTDTSLQSASQNNNLDAAYVTYLKTALAKYQTDMQEAYKNAGPKGKDLLNTSFESTRALLNSSPIKS